MLNLIEHSILIQHESVIKNSLKIEPVKRAKNSSRKDVFSYRAYWGSWENSYYEKDFNESSECTDNGVVDWENFRYSV